MLALRMTPRLHGWGLCKDAGLGTTGEDRPLDRRVGCHRDQDMVIPPERARFGPYRLLRTLDACPVADRFLALHEKRQTSHVVYRFGVFHDAAERRRFIHALEPLARLDQPHLLPVEEYSFAADGRGWVVTPYTGSQIGLMTLSRLLEDKGGRMSPQEADRALSHTLDAARAAHQVGLLHGPISPDEILIDRRGSACIELYGLARRQHAEHAIGDTDSARREEVASIVRIGYQLLTGMAPATPHIPPTRLLKRLDRRWDAFFATGLSPEASYPTAAEALAALPSANSAPPAPARPAAPRAHQPAPIPLRGSVIPDIF